MACSGVWLNMHCIIYKPKYIIAYIAHSIIIAFVCTKAAHCMNIYFVDLPGHTDYIVYCQDIVKLYWETL